MFDQQTNPNRDSTPRLDMSVALEDEGKYDDEEEFFARIPEFSDSAHMLEGFRDEHIHNTTLIQLSSRPGTHLNDVQVDVKVEAESLPQILAVLSVFEANREKSLLPVVAPGKKKGSVVFIGHWAFRGLEAAKKTIFMHGFEIVAYETGPRPGHLSNTYRAVLDKATIAFFVMTGEDATVA